MTQSRKPHAFLLTILLALSTIALSNSTYAEETSARSTGSEEIQITISNSATYFDRTDSSTTTQFTATVTSSNLDVNSEYNIVWNLCNGVAQYDSTGNSHYYTCGSAVDTSDSNLNGEIDIGSGSAFQTTTFTFTDPGISGLENGLYGLKATLRISTVVLDTNSSEVFNLGGELETQGWYTSEVSVNQDFLLVDDISFSASIAFDHAPLGFLKYTIDCSLFEDGVAAAVDATTFVDKTTYWDMEDSVLYLSSGNSNTLTATNGGTHHVECVVIRNVDGTNLGTIVGNDFEVVDATVTGQEALSNPVIASTYYDRSDSTSSTSISFSFDATDLYVGTEYRIEWNLCHGYAQYDNTGNSHYYRCTSAVDTTDSALTGSTTFVAAATTETQSFTFTDPGTSSLDNGLYGIGGNLYVSTIELADNEGEVFNLGGELETQGWYTSEVSVNQDFLLVDDISFSASIAFDHAPLGFLKYTIDCSLFEDGVAAAVDATTFVDKTTYWDMEDSVLYLSSSNSNTLTATNGGTHHVECVVIRNVDGTNLGTIVGNDFEVVDDTSNQDDASISVSVSTHPSENWGSVTVSAIDTDAGQEYTITWEVVDNAVVPPVVLDDGQNTWVGDNSGTHDEVLRFRALDDTSDACISVTFTAGTEDLQTVTDVCWASQSTSDQDGDGVYDKNDECADTATGVVVGSDGCSDSDGDGFDGQYETDCGSDPNDSSSIPLDTDADDTCDALDTDDDDDGYLDVDEIAAGTDPLDPFSMPMNALPTCSLFYAIESDGMPTSFTGDAVIPALSGATAQQGIDSMTPPIVTLGAGSYYIVAYCIDTDGDDITVTVNDVTMGPVAGEVSAGVLIEIGEDVAETMDLTISWTDGTDTLTAVVTLELEGGTTGIVPGFTGLIAISSICCALVFIAFRREDE